MAAQCVAGCESGGGGGGGGDGGAGFLTLYKILIAAITDPNR